MNRMLKWFQAEGMSALVNWFDDTKLADGHRTVNDACRDLAEAMDAQLVEGPEKTTGLRKLLEAKDCFLRANMDGKREPRE